MNALTNLSPQQAAAELIEEADEAWVIHLADAIDRRLRTRPLTRFMKLWDLSASQAAKVFGVSRQAFSKWLQTDPPADRSDQIAAIGAATDLLDRYVRRDRIPAVVRRPSPIADGNSLLEIAEAGELDRLKQTIEKIFDLGRIAP